MKNFEINVFDEKKLIKKYTTLKVEEELSYSNIEELILGIFNSKNNIIRIHYYIDIPWLSMALGGYDSISSKDEYFKREFICDDGSIQSPSWVSAQESNAEENGLKIPKYKMISTDKNIDIYLKKVAEDIYTDLSKLWIDVAWFSWILDNDDEKQEALIIKDFYFSIQINDRELFMEQSIKFLINKNKWEYSPDKLKELVIKNIQEENAELGKEWKDIPIWIMQRLSISEIKNTLIILHLEEKIRINSCDFNHSFRIDILNISQWYIENQKLNSVPSESEKHDRRKLKRWILANQLTLELKALELIVYLKSSPLPYLKIDLRDRRLSTKKGEPKKALTHLINLLKGNGIETIEKNRKQIGTLNAMFKKEIKISDNIIISKKTGSYGLVPDIKSYKRTGGDVLDNEGRYISYNDAIHTDEYYNR